MLHPHRLLGTNSEQTRLAYELFKEMSSFGLVCPYSHVHPALLSDAEASFPDPVELFVRRDVRILSQLHSQGVRLEPFLDPSRDPQEIWHLFARHYRLFWGTSTAQWLEHQLEVVFGIAEPLDESSADHIYSALTARLAQPEYLPRAVLERLKVEVLCTTAAATDPLTPYRTMASSDWSVRVLPVFRPDKLLWTAHPDWLPELKKLETQTISPIRKLRTFLEAIRQRRQEFKSLGCVSTDHGCERPWTERLSAKMADDLFGQALKGKISVADSIRLQGHLLIEMARMSLDDGLAMQIHTGSYQDHNGELLVRFGPNKGADLPLATEFTSNLKTLLGVVGNEPAMRLILFTLDETAYGRDLGPLAGHYPAVFVGAPWSFHNGPKGLMRYFDQVVETAGLCNTAGFQDHARSLGALAARHDLWRRISCRWLANLELEGRINHAQARSLLGDLAQGRARKVYGL
jgi:glucuronate isomerase